MKTTNVEVHTNRDWKVGLIVLSAMALLAICPVSNAQTVIGSSGAGWQTWNLTIDPNTNQFIDLNNNAAPYWDVPLLNFSTGGYGGGDLASKSIGWCLTSTGDCTGIGSALYAPGPLQFWGMQYFASSDTGGAMDPKMFFRTSRGQTYQATLFLNTATNTFEINEFGWFETNAAGTLNGTKHVIFQGSGYPPGTLTPDPVGKTVTFTPTQYFGYYYSDVSDPETQNGPEHGCYTSTIFAFNDEDCTAAGSTDPGQGDHNFAIFRQQVSGQPLTYWVAGQDPSLCNNDGDCNLTVVRVRRIGGN